MKTKLCRAAIAVGSLLLSFPVFAEDVPKGPETVTRTVHLTSGGVIEARVLELNDAAIVVEFNGAEGSRGFIARKEIVPADLFDLIVEYRAPKTGDSWMKLATEAESMGLCSARMWSLRNAVRLMPELSEQLAPEIEGCRQKCASDRLRLGKEYLQAGELERARRYFQVVVNEYSGSPAEKESQDLLNQISGNAEKEKELASAVMQERRKAQESQDDLKSIRDLVDRGEVELGLGRESAEHPGAAVGRFDESQALLERAWKLLGCYAASGPITPGLRDAIDLEVRRLKSVVRDDLVAVHLELGQACLKRSNFTCASAHAGEALVLDPENPGIVALRNEITVARSGVGR